MLRHVYGVEEAEKYDQFELPVDVDDPKTGKSTTKYIDAYLPATRVLIEQKSQDIDLTKSYKQSDGSMLTPYQQAGGHISHFAHLMGRGGKKYM